MIGVDISKTGGEKKGERILWRLYLRSLLELDCNLNANYWMISRFDLPSSRISVESSSYIVIIKYVQQANVPH